MRCLLDLLGLSGMLFESSDELLLTRTTSLSPRLGYCLVLSVQQGRDLIRTLLIFASSLTSSDCSVKFSDLLEDGDPFEK